MVHCFGEGIRDQSGHHHVSFPSSPRPRLTPKLAFLHLWFPFLCCLNPHLPPTYPTDTCSSHSDPSHSRATGAKLFSILTVPIARGRALVTWPSPCKLSWPASPGPHPQSFSLWIPSPSQESSFIPASGAWAAVGPRPDRFPREEHRHCSTPSPAPAPASPDWPGSLGSCSALGRGLCGWGREVGRRPI